MRGFDENHWSTLDWPLTEPRLVRGSINDLP